MVRKAKKTKEKKPIDNEQHYCGDCGHGTWYTSIYNIDVHGLPICCHCPFHKTARVRSSRACENWKPKGKGEMVITPNNMYGVNETNIKKMKPYKFKLHG